MRHTPVLLTSLTLLTGCLAIGEAPIPGGVYRLQPPSEGPPLDEWVMVKVDSGGRVQEFIVHARNSGARQDYALLDPVGMVTLLAGSYDGATVVSGGPLADAVPASLPLGAIQLLRWPINSVQMGLPGHLAAAEDAEGGRRLTRGGLTLISATSGETILIRREDPPLLVEIRRGTAK